MTDYEAEKAVNTLIRTYQAEARNRKYRQPRMNERTEEAYGYIKGMCDWRMGREDLYNEDDNPIELPMTPLQVDEVIDCLKRVKRSIRKWNKQGGRRGYFYFVDQFFQTLMRSESEEHGIP